MNSIATMSIPLNAEQCANLPFPPGCPVWWYHHQKQQSSEESNGNTNDSLSMTTIMKRGVIKSAALHNNGAQLFYQVEYKSDKNDASSSSLITEEVADTRLSFGASCPVTIVSNSTNNSSEEEKELLGEIVMSEPSSSTTDSNKIVYTAMIFIYDDVTSSSSRVRYESGIDAERIKYRKVDDNANNTNSSSVAKSNDDANAISASTKDTNCKKSSNDTPAMPTTIQPPVVPASITCSDSIPSKRDITKVAPSSSNDSMAADSSSSRKRARHHHHPNMSAPPNDVVGLNLNVPRLEITVPLWLQRDRKSQRDLFFHLLGGGQNMNRINRESRCRVNIKMNNETFEPLKIHVDTPQSNTALKDLKIARRMIQDLFLEYLGNDGARGRLIYEIASSCWGSHRPNNSTSNAVKEVNPLVQNSSVNYASAVKRTHYMSIVELSYELTPPTGEKSFHAAHILHKPFLAEIAGLGCDLILVADGFRVPTRLCDPYVLVYGKTCRDVDCAVDMVKHKIRQHQQVCGKCTTLS